MDNLFSFPSAAPPHASQQPSEANNPPSSASELDPAASQLADESAEFPLRSEDGTAPVHANATLHVRLKLLDERVFDVHVERTIAVTEFRARVHQATDIPVHLQRLIYRGKLLKDDTLLSSYDIQDGHTIHLVSKPATPATSPPSNSTVSAAASNTASFSDEESATLNRFITRSRERLRQTVADEGTMPSARENEGLAAGGRVMHERRVPSERGGLSGDAWNLAVLREALGHQSDRVPAVASNRVRNAADSPAAVAADLGLSPTTPAVPEQPNLDHITQGILTLRTVLSTAVPPHQQVDDNQASGAVPAEVESDATIEGNSVTVETASPTPSEPVGDQRESPRRSRRRFFVGQWLDVKDTVNQWLECTVMNVSDNKVLVHYHGWPSRWDEWIDVESDRIAAFRTRTQHTQQAPHLSPTPSTRLPNAPPVGENDMRRILPQLRDLMRDALPYIDQLATLCEDSDEDLSEDDATLRQRNLSEAAHVVSPFFDRFGRLLVDSSRQMDSFLRPELRVEERRRRHLRARSSVERPAVTPSIVVEEASESIRDLITTPPPRPLNEDANGSRRSIDVHIHAIVAPSSLSSLASLAGLGTAIVGAMDSGSRSTSQVSRSLRQRMSDRVARPRIRNSQGADSEDEDPRDTDTSRTPLLSSYRSSARGEELLSRRHHARRFLDSSAPDDPSQPVLSDSIEPENEDSRNTDSSRTPLLGLSTREELLSQTQHEDSPSTDTSGTPLPSSSDREEMPSQTPGRQQLRGSAAQGSEDLSDDLSRSGGSSDRWSEPISDGLLRQSYGSSAPWNGAGLFVRPSLSQDSDDMEVLNIEGFGAYDHSDEDQVQYREISSRRESDESDAHGDSQPGQLGVIPEIEAAERREREQQERERSDGAGRDSTSSLSSSSSSSSAGSSGFPTLLEVMRRTLTGVRNFGFSSPSSSSSSTSESDLTSSFDSVVSTFQSAHATDAPSRPRESSFSSIGEDLDSVD